ncbi:FecR family protein [Membranihabitans maritimus]|uniref:FecR family protein n=1 Tax=Membranihabitans maritimus TaxID=2904244 RepID=UPI001F3F55FE|nr:FecR domain-containing protein [Membranihabitans maritimus]
MSKDQYILLKQLIEDSSFIDWANGSKTESSQKWDRWMEENPEQEELVSRAKLIVTGIRFNKNKVEASKIEKELSKLNATIDKKGSILPTINQVKSNWSPWKIAASLLVLIMAGFWGIREIYMNGVQTYHTDFGERQEITLSDGTEVVMNANSTIEFVRKRPRNIKMNGEVFFNVQKKTETGEKFTVQTSDLDIEVLGTVFNVNTRSEKTEVLLEEGSVQLHMVQQESVLMHPGDLISYSEETNTLVRQEKVKTDIVTSWKDGILIFDNTPLREALKLLENIYNIKVKYENQTTAEKILVGGIPNDNLELSLKTLSNIYDLEIEKIEDTVIIR